jgi:hypothetical protein
LPARIVILPASGARPATLGVSASLLRHIPAQSVLLAIHDAALPERQRAACLRQLLDVRSAALAEHALDLRTEIRFGDPDAELERELSVEERTMLVLGLDTVEGDDAKRLAALLEGPRLRPVLVVRAPAGGD